MTSVYSILVHPNRQSLNSSLFNLANDHFKQQGYTVNAVNLYDLQEQIYAADRVLEQTKVSPKERQFQSEYYHNYIKVLDLSPFTSAQVDQLKIADILYIQTPIMVWMLPGLLKKYIENVFVPDGAFTCPNPWSDDYDLVKLLAGKQVFFSITAGAGTALTNHIMGSVDNMTAPIKSMCEFVGYEWLPPHLTLGVTETNNRRQDYLDSFQSHLKFLF
jgi:putative NADPH-quinone reductase